jgi:hypothetical protein
MQEAAAFSLQYEGSMLKGEGCSFLHVERRSLFPSLRQCALAEWRCNYVAVTPLPKVLSSCGGVFIQINISIFEKIFNKS